jgi:hypothetical protein
MWLLSVSASKASASCVRPFSVRRSFSTSAEAIVGPFVRSPIAGRKRVLSSSQSPHTLVFFT